MKAQFIMRIHSRIRFFIAQAQNHWILLVYRINKYSWLSLSRPRPRLSRITAYLEVKIWSLPKDENLTTGNKILWKRGEIAPVSPLFYNIFNISRISRVKLHIHLLNVVVRFIFSSILQSDMSRYGYLEVFQRVPWNSRTGVDCTA